MLDLSFSMHGRKLDLGARAAHGLLSRLDPGDRVALYAFDDGLRAVVPFTADRRRYMAELAQLEQVQPPSISRIVGALEGEGWVERTAVAGDRRVALVSATPKARRALQRARVRRNEWIHDRLAELDATERDRLLAALGVLEHLAEGVGDVARPDGDTDQRR